MGLTDGIANSNYGLSGTGAADIGLLGANYGALLGNVPAGTVATTTVRKAYGLTTDASKSGIKGTL